MKQGVTKAEFVYKLSELLKMTREGVDHLELKDDDTVIIHYREGFGRQVNIAIDSGVAIIRDVTKHM